MAELRSAFWIALISFALYWEFYVPLPEACDYPLPSRIACSVIEVVKTIAAINFALGGRFAAPFSVVDKRTFRNITDLDISYTRIAGVEVAVYKPSGHGKETPGSAMIYFHGGGWTVGSIDAFGTYANVGVLVKADQTKDIYLDAGSESVNNRRVIIYKKLPVYRLAPENPFPAAFDDCVALTKQFLRDASKYGVDPKKVVLSGDSAGGNLAAAVALALGKEQSPNPICMISPIYPILQIANFRLPSYMQNPNEAILDIWFTMRFVLNYIGFGDNIELAPLLSRNAHMEGFDRTELLDRVDEKWVPRKYKKRRYKENFELIPEEGYETLNANRKRIQSIATDVRLSVLTADDSMLKLLPRTHIVTCEYDPLRDDGIILHERMQKLGLNSSLVNWEFGTHGIFSAFGTGMYDRVDAAVDVMLKVIQEGLKAC